MTVTEMVHEIFMTIKQACVTYWFVRAFIIDTYVEKRREDCDGEVPETCIAITRDLWDTLVREGTYEVATHIHET